jgi:hypothetical protein
MSPRVGLEIPGRSSGPYGYGYISIVRASPYNMPDERRRYMAIKGYFDGSGKTADAETDKVLCLGGVSASEDLWPSFERAWGQVLADLPELEFSWHTTDARGVLGPDRFYPAAARLLRVIHDFRDSSAPSPLITYSTTLSFAEYERARSTAPNLWPPEAICVQEVIGRIQIPRDEDLPILLYSDRGEEFMKHVEQKWRHARRHGRVSRGWPWQIEKISEIQGDDLNSSYPLQAADLVAWAVRRHRKYAIQNPGVVPTGWDSWDMSLAAMVLVSTRHVSTDNSHDSIIASYSDYEDGDD